MSGLYLALITLMLAGAITVVLATINFPNGGHGFTGYNGALAAHPADPPARASPRRDPAFFRYSVIVAVADVPAGAGRTSADARAGRGRRSARARPPRSPAGINTTLYKLWAFALASFVTGVAGGLRGRQLPLPELADVRDPGLDHAARGGADGRRYSMWGAVVAGLLLKFLPALLNNWGVSPDWLTILFGIGVLQVLTTAPRGHRRPVAQGHGPARAADPQACSSRPAAPREARAVIEVSDLTVRFGGVTPLDGMSVKFEHGTCGLIGPNGAGKTTFFNVLSGFVKPVAGSVTAFGEDLLKMTHFRRARWGVRRTFQTEQAIEELSVYDNVAMIHEHSKMSGVARREDVLGAIAFVGLDIDPYAAVGTLGAAQRRLVEVARAVVGKPRLVLLDEPAAGLPDEETAHLSEVIREHPRAHAAR